MDHRNFIFYWTTKRIGLIKKNFHIAKIFIMQIPKSGIAFIVFFHKTMELPAFTQANDMIDMCAEYFHNLRIVVYELFCLPVHPPHYIFMFWASLTKFTFTLLKV